MFVLLKTLKTNINTDTRVGLLEFSSYVEAARHLSWVTLDTRTVGAQFTAHERDDR